LRNILRQYFRGLLWILVILVLTGIPGTMIPKIPKVLDLLKPDKLVHVFMFAVLVVLLLNDYRKSPSNTDSTWRPIFISLNIGIFLGAMTEILQGTPLIKGRSSSVYDFIADVAGCFLGWGIFVYWKKRKKA
jgi:VanZ family protein